MNFASIFSEKSYHYNLLSSESGVTVVAIALVKIHRNVKKGKGFCLQFFISLGCQTMELLFAGVAIAIRTSYPF